MHPFVRRYDAERMRKMREYTLDLRSTIIQRRITEMLSVKFYIPEEVLDPDYWDEPLTGSRYQFSATDLTYLFFELEKVFGIRIPHRYLRSYGFCTINKIAKILEQCWEELNIP